MQKQSGEDYTKGVMYNYNVIPDSGKQLFYYYEASNGVGKARDAIIDGRYKDLLERIISSIKEVKKYPRNYNVIE